MLESRDNEGALEMDLWRMRRSSKVLGGRLRSTRFGDGACRKEGEMSGNFFSYRDVEVPFEGVGE
jgi:hypothetical protein